MNVSSLNSLKRAPEAASAPSRSRNRSWLILPALISGFLLLAFFLFGDRLRPRLEVRSAPAVLLENTGAKGQSGTAPTGDPQTLTQASGWIEPDPYPIRVPVKVDGLVETVEVLEGQTVQAGQLLATLDPADFKLHLRAQESALASARAAKNEKEQAVQRAAAECARAEAGVQAATARLAEQQDRLRRLLALDEGVVPEDERLQVEREVAVGKADLAAAKAELQGHMAHQQVEKAGVETAAARISELEAQVDRARLDLERTRIVSPVDGVVLHRFAAPGGKRMRGMDDPDSATVVSLFQPDKLQVRVDVPLAEAGQVVTGMPARIRLSAFPDREFAGVVTRILGQADLTRNTLQVKVKVQEPDPRMRPEMLCRVEFLSLPKVGNSGGTGFRPSETVWIPLEALHADGKVWVVDPVTQQLSVREVESGTEVRENYQSVRKGLRPGERVVLGSPSGLKVGLKVKEVE